MMEKIQKASAKYIFKPLVFDLPVTKCINSFMTEVPII